jgi:hypothetical protein
VHAQEHNQHFVLTRGVTNNADSSSDPEYMPHHEDNGENSEFMELG